MKLSILLALLAPATALAGQGGGGGMGSGGGNFTVPIFWQRVEQEIVPALKLMKAEPRTPALLTQLQIDSLLYLMNPRVTRVSLSREPLYWTQDGVKTAVDALNYPARRRIRLYLQSWQHRVDSGFDVGHLILHEFLGLARIDDTAGLSAKIIPPTRRPIDFESSVARCETFAKYVRFKNGEWEIRDHPGGEKVSVSLSAPRSLNPNPKCAVTDPGTGACLQKVGDFKLREGEARVPVIFDEGDHPEGRYQVDVSLQLVGPYNAYGWGAAASRVFKQNTELHIIWKLVHTDASGKSRVLTLVHNSASETDSHSEKTTLYQAIPAPAFVETIERNGFKLSLFPSGGEMSAPFKSQNIAAFMGQVARDAGHGDSYERMSSFLTNRVFAGATGNAIPFRVHAQCELGPK